MGRPLRILYPGALYHITSRGNEKKAIYLDDLDRKRFIEILEDYHDRLGVLIHCYVLMNNHYHIVMETPEGNLLKVMHGINSGYTGYFNRKYSRVGHLFQGRYQGILVDKDSYLLEVSRYVHLNPVRAKIVEKPEQYKWSSYSGYIGKGEELKWVEYSWILSNFGSDKKKARSEYRKFVEEGIKERVEDPFNNVYGKVLLGGEKFRENVRGLIKEQHLDEGIVGRKRFRATVNIDDLVRAVVEAFGVDEKEIKMRGGRNNLARNVAIYLAKRYSGLSNQEIGGIFDGINYSAVSKVTGRIEEKMKTDRELYRIIKDIKSHVKA
jgi:REP element-mobilizing transposase RayT